MKKAREQVLDYLLNEVWGPVIPADENAVALPTPVNGVFKLPLESKKLRIVDTSTGDLVITGSEPTMIYGTGVLHTLESGVIQSQSSPAATAQDDDQEFGEADSEAPEVESSGSNYSDGGIDDDSFALEQSQKRLPSAMGLSFEPDLVEGDSLKFIFEGAIYEKIQIQYGDEKPQTGWQRKQFRGENSIVWSAKNLSLDNLHTLELSPECDKYVSMKVRFRAGPKHADAANENLIATAVVKNIGSNSKGHEVFQSRISVEIVGKGSFRNSLQNSLGADEEQLELNHLYRHTKAYAAGHGTSVEWETSSQDPVRVISTTAVPLFHQEVLDFESFGPLSMKTLAGAKEPQLRSLLEPLTTGYSEWIASEKAKSSQEAPDSSETITNLVSKAEHIALRIREGFDLLFQDDKVLRAFQLTNEAMYKQQWNGRLDKRIWNRNLKEPFHLAVTTPPKGQDKIGFWRPFQMAFLLAAIPGLVNPDHESREEVDLIFFPTGGGKTEAYLGASAFMIIYRRLSGDRNEDYGVDVLMRYTLRLLTIQQFERSAGLICALEQMRQTDYPDLGTKPISIGVWLGSATTPNRRAEALAELVKNKKDRREEDPNPFILGKCPVCAAEFGWDDRKVWRGYDRSPKSGADSTLRFICSDNDCFFGNKHNPLPIWITDEDVYANKPSFILGTVDKFAQMAWQPMAKRLFNLNSQGVRIGPPPALVIQDELHLISGPLGSVVGLYEPALEELCTDRRGSKPIKPKIVASTATTRRFENQVKALYGRPNVMLFPQAIDRVNETYFSSVLRDKETGKPENGSLYVGINPGTYISGQTSAAKIAAILRQAPNVNPNQTDPEMDFYRTSVWFFNSLRELGMTLTLMNSVVRDMIGGLRIAKRLPGEKAQYPYRILELTSRIESTKVATSLASLSLPSWDPKSYDTCLASSIMEVGVDVPRLGLLTIMGQPKTTSQYIQVSGRVGRARKDGPGLIVMLYNAGRARDRSVYERFHTYHQSLYAQVEPISVTPFAIQAMQKALKGAIIALYRMRMPDDSLPNAVDWEVFDNSVEVFRDRMNFLDQKMQNHIDFEKQVEKLRNWWSTYSPSVWRYDYKEEKGIHLDDSVPALMRGRREKMSAVIGDHSIQVMTSMRSVDGQTTLEITKPYAFEDGDL